jgi:hypothetical protein
MGEGTMRELIERKDWAREKSIFLDGKGFWPKEIIIKEDKEILRYRLIRTRTGKFQLVK